MKGEQQTRIAPLSEEENIICENLRRHIRVLAGDIGERNVFAPEGLARAVRSVEDGLTRAGLQPSREEFEVEGTTACNVVASFRGQERPNEIVVFGAHYDSVMGCPGANDNASGVAALLEIARLLAGLKLSRTVRFVAFVNEEPPFFRTRQMGSYVHAERSRRNGDVITGMLSLETIAYYVNRPHSQRYPFPFRFFYPDTGNFIGFVGNLPSRSLVRRCVRSFRHHTTFPVESLSAPGWIMGLGWSDHWAFWKFGYPAVMVTDTAPFRYPWYHTPLDTPDRLSYPETARVTLGLYHVVRELVNGP